MSNFDLRQAVSEMVKAESKMEWDGQCILAWANGRETVHCDYQRNLHRMQDTAVIPSHIFVPLLMVSMSVEHSPSRYGNDGGINKVKTETLSRAFVFVGLHSGWKLPVFREDR